MLVAKTESPKKKFKTSAKDYTNHNSKFKKPFQKIMQLDSQKI